VQKFIVATCIRTLVAEAEAREKDWVDVSRKLDETLDERDAALAVVNEMLNALGEEAWREDYPQLAQRARALLERGK
jgi:signal recognition particle GTPase